MIEDRELATALYQRATLEILQFLPCLIDILLPLALTLAWLVTGKGGGFLRRTGGHRLRGFGGGLLHRAARLHRLSTG